MYYGHPPEGLGQNRVRFGTACVHRAAINLEFSRICPECFREDGYVRMAWGVACLPLCPRHGTRLIDRCPSCLYPLTWARVPMRTCAGCGTDLGQHPGSTDAVSAAAVALTSLILAKAGLSDGESTDASFPEAFRAMDFADMVDTVTLLGGWVGGRASGIGRQSSERPSLEQSVAELAAVADLLASWPTSFHERIDRLLVDGDLGATKAKLADDLGPLYTKLFPKVVLADPPFGALAFTRQAFRGYVLNGRWRGYGPGPARSLRSQDRHIPVSEAARLLRRPVPLVRKHVEAGLLATSRRRSGRGMRVLIDRDGLDGFRPESADILSFRAARRLVGIEKVPFVDLASRGMIERMGAAASGAPTSWLFRRSQIPSLHSRNAAGPRRGVLPARGRR